MNQTTLLKRMSKDISSVQKELNRVRSLIFGLIIKDKEGRYQAKFIQEIYKAAEEKPVYKFKNSQDFLKQLKTKKD